MPNIIVTNPSGGVNADLVIPVSIKDSNGDPFITFTETGTGTARIETPQDDLSLRSARDITLFPGSDGPGNVYIGWGDANYTPNATNKVATIQDIQDATIGLNYIQETLWDDFTPYPNQSVKISPVLDHQSILMQSDEEALLRYHVRDSNFDANGFDVTGLDSYIWHTATSTSPDFIDGFGLRTFAVDSTGFYEVGDYAKVWDASDDTRWYSGTITALVADTSITIYIDSLASGADPAIETSLWKIYSATIVWAITPTERILPMGYHYEMNGVMGFDGYYRVPSTTLGTVTMQYTNPQFNETWPAEVQALDFAAENINAYLSVPSIYSQFRTKSNGAWIQNANWTENPTYSYDWHFRNDGVLDTPGKINDNYGNIRSIPQIGKYYTYNVDRYVDDTWSGRHIYFTYNGGWDAIYIPDDASLNLPIGFTFTIVTDDNEPGQWIYINANDENLTYVSAVGLDYSSIGYDLSNNSIVTVMKIDDNRWIISGYGIQRD